MRRRAPVPSAVITVAAFLSAAGTTSAQTTVSSAEAELVALDSAWIEAEVRQDRAALERILHEEFVATFASGRTVDRTAFIEGILQATIEPFEVVHEVIRVHGDAALVIDASPDGTSKYTWIAVKREGRWRVISETFTNARVQ